MPPSWLRIVRRLIAHRHLDPQALGVILGGSIHIPQAMILHPRKVHRIGSMMVTRAHSFDGGARRRGSRRQSEMATYEHHLDQAQVQWTGQILLGLPPTDYVNRRARVRIPFEPEDLSYDDDGDVFEPVDDDFGTAYQRSQEETTSAAVAQSAEFNLVEFLTQRYLQLSEQSNLFQYTRAWDFSLPTLERSLTFGNILEYPIFWNLLNIAFVSIVAQDQIQFPIRLTFVYAQTKPLVRFVSRFPDAEEEDPDAPTLDSIYTGGFEYRAVNFHSASEVLQVLVDGLISKGRRILSAREYLSAQDFILRIFSTDPNDQAFVNVQSLLSTIAERRSDTVVRFEEDENEQMFDALMDEFMGGSGRDKTEDVRNLSSAVYSTDPDSSPAIIASLQNTEYPIVLMNWYRILVGVTVGNASSFPSLESVLNRAAASSDVATQAAFNVEQAQAVIDYVEQQPRYLPTASPIYNPILNLRQVEEPFDIPMFNYMVDLLLGKLYHYGVVSPPDFFAPTQFTETVRQLLLDFPDHWNNPRMLPRGPYWSAAFQTKVIDWIIARLADEEDRIDWAVSLQVLTDQLMKAFSYVADNPDIYPNNASDRDRFNNAVHFYAAFLEDPDNGQSFQLEVLHPQQRIRGGHPHVTQQRRRRLRGGWSLFEIARRTSPDVNPFLTDVNLFTRIQKALFLFPAIDSSLARSVNRAVSVQHRSALDGLPFRRGFQEASEVIECSKKRDAEILMHDMSRRSRFSCFFDCLETILEHAIPVEEKVAGCELEHPLSRAIRSTEYRNLRITYYGKSVQLTALELFLTHFDLQLDIRRPLHLDRTQNGMDVVKLTHVLKALDSSRADAIFKQQLYPTTHPQNAGNVYRIPPIALIADHYFLYDVALPINRVEFRNWLLAVDGDEPSLAPGISFYTQVHKSLPRSSQQESDCDAQQYFRSTFLYTRPSLRKKYLLTQHLWMALVCCESRLVKKGFFTPIDPREMLYWLFNPDYQKEYFRKAKASAIEMPGFTFDTHLRRIIEVPPNLSDSESPHLMAAHLLKPWRDFSREEQLPKGARAQLAFFTEFPEALRSTASRKLSHLTFRQEKQKKNNLRRKKSILHHHQFPIVANVPSLESIEKSIMDKLRAQAESDEANGLIAGKFSDVLSFDTETYNLPTMIQGSQQHVVSKVCPYLVMWLSLKLDADSEPEALRNRVTQWYHADASTVHAAADLETTTTNSMNRDEFLQRRHLILPSTSGNENDFLLGNSGSYIPFFQWVLERYGQQTKTSTAAVCEDEGKVTIPKILIYAHNSTFDMAVLLHQDSSICISRCERGSKNVTTQFLLKGRSMFDSTGSPLNKANLGQGVVLSVYVIVYDSYRMIPLPLRKLPDALGLLTPVSKTPLCQLMVKEEIAYNAYNETTVLKETCSWSDWLVYTLREVRNVRNDVWTVPTADERSSVEEYIRYVEADDLTIAEETSTSLERARFLERRKVMADNVQRWSCWVPSEEVCEMQRSIYHRLYAFHYCFNDVYILLQSLIQWRAIWFSMCETLDAFHYCSLPSISEAFLVHHGVYIDVPTVGGACQAFLQKSAVGAKIAANEEIAHHDHEFGSIDPFQVLIGRSTALEDGGTCTWIRRAAKRGEEADGSSAESPSANGVIPTELRILQSEHFGTQLRGNLPAQIDGASSECLLHRNFTHDPTSDQALVDFDAVGLYLSVMATTPGGFMTGVPEVYAPPTSWVSLKSFLQEIKGHYGAYTIALKFPADYRPGVDGLFLSLPNASYVHPNTKTRMWTNNFSHMGHVVCSHVMIQKLLCELHELSDEFLSNVRVYGGLVWKASAWNSRIHQVAKLLKDRRDECKEDAKKAQQRGEEEKAMALNAMQLVYKLLGNSAYGKNGQKLTTVRNLIIHGLSTFTQFLESHSSSVLSYAVIRAPSVWEQQHLSSPSWLRMMELTQRGSLHLDEVRTREHFTRTVSTSFRPEESLNPHMDKKWSFTVELPLNPSKTEQRNRVHVAALILDEAKYVMARVTKACQMSKGVVYYQDTDSMHISRRDLAKLEVEYAKQYPDLPPLVGKGFLQFHSDFEEPKLTLGEPSCEDVVSTEFIFCGKKVYANRLHALSRSAVPLSTSWPPFVPSIGLTRLLDSRKDAPCTQAVQFRSKGLPLPTVVRLALRAPTPVLEDPNQTAVDAFLFFFANRLAFGSSEFAFELTAGEGGASLFRRIAKQQIKSSVPTVAAAAAATSPHATSDGGLGRHMATHMGSDTVYVSLSGNSYTRCVAFSHIARTARLDRLKKSYQHVISDHRVDGEAEDESMMMIESAVAMSDLELVELGDY